MDNLGIGENCSITGNVSVSSIAGYLYDNCYVTNCYNKSDLTVGGYSGGLFGQIRENSIVTNCYNMGHIEANGNVTMIGGITGCLADSTISSCYNNAIINSSSTLARGVAGIAGELGGNSIISNCYNAKTVYSAGVAGGIGATNNIIYPIKVENCYNVGEIIGELEKSNDILGIYDNCSIINCYISTDTFNYENLGNAFKEDANNINNGYPILEWQ